MLKSKPYLLLEKGSELINRIIEGRVLQILNSCNNNPHQGSIILKFTVGIDTARQTSKLRAEARHGTKSW